MRRGGFFWVLQWEDGKYYAAGRISGYESIDQTDDPLRAVHYDTRAAAVAEHDQQGCFRGVKMVAVKICWVIRDAANVPAKEGHAPRRPQ